VNVELERPVQTSAGEITSAALVLIDLETREGTTGRAYIRSYTTIVLEPLRRLVENLGKTLEGDTLAPQEIERKLQVMFRLLGPQGLTGIAASCRDRWPPTPLSPRRRQPRTREQAAAVIQ
jgi:mandelate racemase